MTTLTLRDAVEVVLEGYTLHEGARKILETAIAHEQEIVRLCKTCKFFTVRNGAVCRSCNEDYSNWEPKP